jgi:hypothetical protein
VSQSKPQRSGSISFHDQSWREAMGSKDGLLQQDLDITAQHLLAPLGTAKVLEIDNVDAVATIDAGVPVSEDALSETSEIQLTAEQMNAMLGEAASS